MDLSFKRKCKNVHIDSWYSPTKTSSSGAVFFLFSGFCVTPVMEQVTLYMFLRVTIHVVLVQSPAAPLPSRPQLSKYPSVEVVSVLDTSTVLYSFPFEINVS